MNVFSRELRIRSARRDVVTTAGILHQRPGVRKLATDGPRKGPKESRHCFLRWTCVSVLKNGLGVHPTSRSLPADAAGPVTARGWDAMHGPAGLGRVPVALTTGVGRRAAEPRSVETGQFRTVVLQVLCPQGPAGFLLHKLPLTVYDAEDEQGQQDGGQGAADHGSQGRVPWAGGRGRDPHQVDLAGTVWLVGGRRVSARHTLHVLKTNKFGLPVKSGQAVPTDGVTGGRAVGLLEAAQQGAVQARLALLKAPVLLEPVRPAPHTLGILPVAKATFLGQLHAWPTLLAENTIS